MNNKPKLKKCILVSEYDGNNIFRFGGMLYGEIINSIKITHKIDFLRIKEGQFYVCELERINIDCNVLYAKLIKIKEI